MMLAHSAGSAATFVMSAAGVITGFIVLSSFPAVRGYLSEQLPTALRDRGYFAASRSGGSSPPC